MGTPPAGYSNLASAHLFFLSFVSFFLLHGLALGFFLGFGVSLAGLAWTFGLGHCLLSLVSCVGFLVFGLWSWVSLVGVLEFLIGRVGWWQSGLAGGLPGLDPFL